MILNSFGDWDITFGIKCIQAIVQIQQAFTIQLNEQVIAPSKGEKSWNPGKYVETYYKHLYTSWKHASIIFYLFLGLLYCESSYIFKTWKSEKALEMTEK